LFRNKKIIQTITGDYMKKYIVSLLLIFILNIVINKEETILVFSEKENEYSMYVLEFPNYNISTNNIEKKFKDIKIIWIEPYINGLYKLNYKYYFEDISIKQNFNKFKTNLIKKLNSSNYKNLIINYEITGIKVNKMQVYCKESDILNLNIDGIKYQKNE